MSNSKIELTIDSADECAELYLHDGAFKLLATGLGSLTASVASGLYKVRQRIGDSERSCVLDVEDESHIMLAEMKLENLGVPFAATHSETNLAIVIPYYFQVFAGVQLQSQSGEEVGITSFNRYVIDDRYLQLEAKVVPGRYSLVRTLRSGEIRRRPLWVAPETVLHAFLPTPSLTGGSIFYVRRDVIASPKDSKFLQCEVARLAFQSVRTEIAPAIMNAVPRNPYAPTMALYAGYLYTGDGKLRDARNALKVASEILGQECPDVMALRSILDTAEILRLRSMQRIGTEGFVERGLTQDMPRFEPGPNYKPMLAAGWTATGLDVGADENIHPNSGTWLTTIEPEHIQASPVESFAPVRSRDDRYGTQEEPLTKLIESKDLEEWLQHLRAEEIAQGEVPILSMGKSERDLLLSLVSVQRAVDAALIDRSEIEGLLSGAAAPNAIAVNRAAVRLFELYENRGQIQGEGEGALVMQ